MASATTCGPSSTARVSALISETTANSVICSFPLRLPSKFPNFNFRIPSSKFPISNFHFQISIFKFPFSNFHFQISKFPISFFNFQFNISKFLVPNFKFRIPSSKFRVPSPTGENLTPLSIQFQVTRLQRSVTRTPHRVWCRCPSPRRSVWPYPTRWTYPSSCAPASRRDSSSTLERLRRLSQDRPTATSGRRTSPLNCATASCSSSPNSATASRSSPSTRCRSMTATATSSR